MMGSQEAQGALFYEFSIEAHVPLYHMLRYHQLGSRAASDSTWRRFLQLHWEAVG